MILIYDHHLPEWIDLVDSFKSTPIEVLGTSFHSSHDLFSFINDEQKMKDISKQQIPKLEAEEDGGDAGGKGGEKGKKGQWTKRWPKNHSRV